MFRTGALARRVAVRWSPSASAAPPGSSRCLRQGPGLRHRSDSSSAPHAEPPFDLQIGSVHAQYAAGRLRPSQLAAMLCERIEATKSNNAWIFRPPTQHILGQAESLDRALAAAHRGSTVASLLSSRPLFGVPFSAKDNLDVAGYPTTAGCADYAYTPWQHATAVHRALEAGGIFLGKTNMDQFATGLVGVRSPYGAVVNSFSEKHCAGGSSSGSAVSVATGLCSFSIGTDTAGSGRIPAALNNVVGLKPSRGLLSGRGMVPACRSLDCLSLFSLSVDDAWTVFLALQGYDPLDEYSLREPPPPPPRPRRLSSLALSSLSSTTSCPADLSDLPDLRFGIPRRAELMFFGADVREATAVYVDAVRRAAERCGASVVEIDFRPFTEVARVLYEGPWVAERLSAIRDFFRARPDSLLPVTRSIIGRGDQFSAVDLFLAQRRLERLRRECDEIWTRAELDVLLVPTASITPTRAEVADLPIGINTVLGYYTNFVNLLNMCALAVPAGWLPNGMPAGVSLIAPMGGDRLLGRLGRRLQRAAALPLGATPHTLRTSDPPPAWDAPDAAPAPDRDLSGRRVTVAVVGAHLSGMPLNGQLRELGATLLSEAQTAAAYRLCALDGSPPRPGLVRVPSGGARIELELWSLPDASVGRLLQRVPPPLALGNVALADGREVKGFVCEAYAAERAADITHFGGWRKYVAATQKAPEKEK